MGVEGITFRIIFIRYYFYHFIIMTRRRRRLLFFNIYISENLPLYRSRPLLRTKKTNILYDLHSRARDLELELEL